MTFFHCRLVASPQCKTHLHFCLRVTIYYFCRIEICAPWQAVLKNESLIPTKLLPKSLRAVEKKFDKRSFLDEECELKLLESDRFLQCVMKKDTDKISNKWAHEKLIRKF